MVQFETDDRGLERALIALGDEFERCGGFIHADLRIGANESGFVVKAPAALGEKETLVRLPRGAFLPVDKFTLALQGADICVVSHDADLPAHQVRLLELMLELYNRTDKIGFHKKTDTMQLYLKDKPLLFRLLKCREHGRVQFSDTAGEDVDSFHLTSFLNTRVLKLRLDPNSTEMRKILMPVIDFLNNHPKAEGLQSKDGENVSILKMSPVAGSEECYIRYGMYDALDCLIRYSYAEEHGFFVRSAPMTIELPPLGRLRVKSTHTPGKYKTLPKEIHDVWRHLPNVKIDVGTNVAEVEFIHIPQADPPFALRRVLAVVLKTMMTHLKARMTEEAFSTAILTAEHEIVARNVKLYEDFEKDLSTYVAKRGCELVVDNAKRVMRLQRESIERYPFFEEAMAFEPPAPAAQFGYGFSYKE